MKPLLLGMNNPLSDDPEYDLFPYPEGSAGHRLWKLAGCTRSQYLAGFDRMNLLRARTWDVSAARSAALALLPALSGRVVVVLGTEVRAALGLQRAEPLSLNTLVLADGSGVTLRWVAFPHPSGRNRWFNEPANQEAAAGLLRALLALGDGVERAWEARSLHDLVQYEGSKRKHTEAAP